MNGGTENDSKRKNTHDCAGSANGECPYRGDVCPTSEHPEVCKYAEYAEKQPEIPQLSAEELAKTLRLCGSASCCGCAFSKNFDCGNIILTQAADMLEKLEAERARA